MTTKSYYKLNAARCFCCDEVLVATEKNKQHQCHCGNLIVTGDRGSQGLIRYVRTRRLYEELSLYDTGHPASSGHAMVLPITALEPLKPGKWFVQNQLDVGNIPFVRRMDEAGQKLWEDDIEISSDDHYHVFCVFRFYPVANYKLYNLGDVSKKSIRFHHYALDKIIKPFMKNGQTKGTLIKVLEKEGFQDRSGMRALREDTWS